MAHRAMRINVCLVDELLLALELVKVLAASLLAIVCMTDASSYLICLLPTLNGLGAWRVRKLNQEPLLQTKEIGFFPNGVDIYEAKVLTHQRIRRGNISVNSFFKFLCCCYRCRRGTNIEIHQALII